MNKFMKKIALALICCLTINSSSSIIAMEQQTDLKEGDTLTPIIQEVSEEVKEEANSEDTVLEPEEEISQEDQVKEEVKEEEANSEDTVLKPEEETPQEEQITEEEVPAIPEDIRKAILAGSKSTLYNTDFSIDNKSVFNYTEGDANKLELRKKATPLGNDKYEIQLDVSGTANQAKPTKADIVIVIDRSSSMTNNNSPKLENTKEGVNSFIDTVLGNGASNIGISLVAFSTKADILTNNGNSSFINDSAALKSIVSNIKSSSGTNTEAAMNRVDQLLTESKADKKYVVFFTDGEPSKYCINGDLYGDKTNSGYDGNKGRTYAKAAYDKIFADNKNQGVKFYTIAVFDGGANDTIKDFLYSIQNVVTTSRKDYLANYYLENPSLIQKLFKTIADDVKSDINNTIAKNITINDTLTKYFKFDLTNGLPENFRIVDYGYNPEKLEINKGINYNVAVNGDTISITNINEIKEPGISIRFTVSAIDPYYFGKDVPTNTVADIAFTDPIDSNKKGTGVFPVPIVQIAPKIGQINVTKNVTKSAGITTDTTNDTFSVLINDNIDGIDCSYNMDVKDNETKTMKFIMKGLNTDINDKYLKEYLSKVASNEIKKYGFVIVGNYSVKEIVPMNYKQTSLTIDNVNTDNFTLDKDNPIISIKLKNNLENALYFFDKFTKVNRFTLPVPSKF